MRRTCFIIAILFGITPAIVGLLVAAGQFLIVDDHLKRADLCLALDGAESRARYAIQLYRDGLCDQLMFINDRENSSSALFEGRKELAVANGVPEEAILVDSARVYSTYAELKRLKAIRDADSILSTASMTLISDPYHTQRTKITFGWIFGGSTALQMAPVPFDLTPQEQFWWTDSKSANMVGREYVKIVYYWLRYRLAFTPLSNWLARFEKSY